MGLTSEIRHRTAFKTRPDSQVILGDVPDLSLQEQACEFGFKLVGSRQQLELEHWHRQPRTALARWKTQCLPYC